MVRAKLLRGLPSPVSAIKFGNKKHGCGSYFVSARFWLSRAQSLAVRTDLDSNTSSHELAPANNCTWAPCRSGRVRLPCRALSRCPVGPAGVSSARPASLSASVQHGALHRHAAASAHEQGKARDQLLGRWHQPFPVRRCAGIRAQPLGQRRKQRFHLVGEAPGRVDHQEATTLHPHLGIGGYG